MPYSGVRRQGPILVALNRDDYWQVAYVIAKGTLEPCVRKDSKRSIKRSTRIAPFLASRVHEVNDWDDIKLLEVKVDRLEQWYRPGILFIGDAAHAMSPIGGVGINLAIQDAVAAGIFSHQRLRRPPPFQTKRWPRFNSGANGRRR